MKTDTTTMIAAMYELARTIRSDGVANAAIFEAAERLGLQHAEIARLTKQNEAYAGLSKAREGQLSFHRAKADEYRTAELAKAKARLARGEDPARVLEGLAAGLVNKILHHPTQALNRAAEGERDSLVRAVEILFPDNGNGREEAGEP